MQKDFRKDPRTVVSRQGDQIVVSLPDGTIENARDAKHFQPLARDAKPVHHRPRHPLLQH